MHKKKRRADTRNKNQRNDVKGDAQDVTTDPTAAKLGGRDKKMAQGMPN